MTSSPTAVAAAAATVDPDEKRNGLLRCGYKLEDSLQFQACDIQLQDEIQTTADGKKTTSYLIYALLGILALVILNFIFNR